MLQNNSLLKLRVMIGLDVLLYCAIFLLGAWPIVTKQHDSSSGFVAIFILLSLFLGGAALICGGVCYLILRLRADEVSARLRTSVALFIAPFFSMLTFWFLSSLANLGLSPLALPILFSLPFIVAILAKHTQRSQL